MSRVVSVHSVQVAPGPVKVSLEDEDAVSISVLLNSVMAIFFPCCHLHPCQGEEGHLAEVRVERLRSRQVSCYQLHS